MAAAIKSLPQMLILPYFYEQEVLDSIFTLKEEMTLDAFIDGKHCYTLFPTGFGKKFCSALWCMLGSSGAANAVQ